MNEPPAVPTDDESSLTGEVVLRVDEAHVAYLRDHLRCTIEERLDRWPDHEHAYRDPFDEFSQIQEFRRWCVDLERGEIVGEPDHLADVLGDLLAQLRRSKIRITGDEAAFEHLLAQLGVA